MTGVSSWQAPQAQSSAIGVEPVLAAAPPAGFWIRALDKLVLVGGAVSLALCLTMLAFARQDQSGAWILPLSFLLAYLLFLRRAIHSGGAPIVAITTTMLFFVSGVLYPALIATIGPNYIGRQYIPITSRDVQIAVFTIAYSILAGSACLALLARSSTPAVSRKPLVLTGNIIIYWSVAMMAAAAAFMIELPEGSIGLAFLMNEAGAKQELMTPLQLVARQLMVVGLGLGYIMFLSWAARGYRSSPTLFYVGAAMVAAMILTSLVVGDRRSVQVLTGLTAIVLSVRLFPQHRNLMIAGIAGVMTFVVLLITATRLRVEEGAFAVMSEFSDPTVIAQTVQIYFSGVESVATNIALAHYVSVDMVDFLFDFGRSTFGLNFLLRDMGPLTSQVYNLFLYNQQYETGQILFAPGYGYIYFGFWLSPIIIMLNISIAFALERLFRKTHSIELAYLYLYCLFRALVLVLVNTPMILSVLTMQFATFGVVMLAANLLRGPEAGGEKGRAALAH